jgi:hypothetical protein
MAKDVNALGFTGMENLRETAGYLLNDHRQITPRMILNADVRDDGMVIKRGGQRKVVSLSNCHSGWPPAGASGSVMLCVADGADGPALHRLDGLTAVEIGPVWGPGPFAYEEVAGHVYLSNAVFHGVYEIATGSLRPWGLPVPPRPEIEAVDGDLPEGKYRLRYTLVDSSRATAIGAHLGGAGPSVSFVWSGGTAGVKLLNRPPGTACWLTNPDGDSFFLARVEPGDEIRRLPTVQALPTLAVEPPIPLYPLCFAFGRLWGGRGGALRYSDEFRPEWFRRANTISFLEELTVIAAVNAGLFVSSAKSTWLLEGQDPARGRIRRMGEGAIAGTLVYAQIEGSGYEVSRHQTKSLSAVWLSSQGWVVGTPTGHLVHLSDAKIKMQPMGPGAALWRLVDGLPQLLVSLLGTSNLSSEHNTMLASGQL